MSICRATAAAGVLLCAVSSLGFQAADPPRHLVLISIDGLMPATYTGVDADRVPTIKTLARNGAYAEGVVGVLPTVTYPSHTTLITGVVPAVHGIYGNEIFDPEGRSNDAWEWYARDIRVPTLLDAGRSRGLTTATFFWPVTVGANVDYLVPEYWRPGSTHPSDLSLIRALSTPGLLDAVERSRGAPLTWPFTDAQRTAVAVHVIETSRPRIVLLHLTELDSAQHRAGPRSAAALDKAQEIDGYVSRIRDAIVKAGIADRTYLAIASDHGFAPIAHQLHLNAVFRDEGLLRVGDGGRIADWDAYAKPEGGTAFVFVRNPSDGATTERVRRLLDRLRADPANGIETILSRDELTRFGAEPGAMFGVGMRIGFYTGLGLETVVTPTVNRGGHGFAPAYPELHASFVVDGPAVKGRGSLGIVRMTQIAPTLASLLGLTLSDKADAPIAVTPASASAVR